MTDQPSPGRRSFTRSVRWFVVVLAVLGLSTAAGAAATQIDASAQVSERAVRVPGAIAGPGLLFPVDPEPVCVVFDNFGGDSKARGSGGHQGLDIGTDFRQEVYAVEDGELYRAFSGGSSGLGWGLWSDTDVKYRYYHLDQLEPGLAVGDRVARGQRIGWVGDTGNAAPGGWHLHFEVRPGPHPRYGSAPPVDPMPLLAIPPSCT